MKKNKFHGIGLHYISISALIQFIILLGLAHGFEKAANLTFGFYSFVYYTIHCMAVAGVLSIVSLLIYYIFFLCRLPKIGLYLVVAIGSFFSVSFFVDYKVYSLMALHLDNDFVINSLFSKGFIHEVKLGTATMICIILSIMVMFLVNIFISKMSYKLLSGKVFRIACVMLVLFGAAIPVSLYADKKNSFNVNMLDAYPYSRMKNFPALFKSSPVRSVNYPLTSTDKQFSISKKPNILLIIIESLRPDACNNELMPHTSRFIKDHNCIQSVHHFPGGHATQFGLFSLLYGLSPSHYVPFKEKFVKSYPITLLAKSGYKTYFFTSSDVNEWGGAHFMFTNFNEYCLYNDPVTWRGDRQMIKEAAKKLASSQSPYLGAIFINSTHHNYYYPPEFQKYTPVMPENYNHLAGDDKLIAVKDLLFNRYKNSVLFADSLLNELFASFARDIESGNLIIAITGDHGEEFFEFGRLGHASDKFNRFKTETPFFIYIPGVNGKKVPISWSSDIFPTIIDSLYKNGPDASSYSDGCSLLSHTDPYVYICNSGFPVKGEKVSIITDKEKMTFQCTPPSFDLMELMEVTDLYDKPILQDDSNADYLQLYREKFVHDLSRFITFK